MVTGIDLVKGKLRPIRFTLRLNLFQSLIGFIIKTLEKNLQEANIMLSGILVETEKKKLVAWREDFDQLDSIQKIVELLQSTERRELYRLREISCEMSLKVNEIRNELVNGEEMDATEYLNHSEGNKKFLLKQIDSEETFTVEID